MIAPIYKYGCGNEICTACYGDAEWRAGQYRECEYCGDNHDEEAHGDAVVIREGASTRTADDLAVTFLEDVAELYALTFPARKDGGRAGRLVLEADANYWRGKLPDGGWLPTGSAMSSDDLFDTVSRFETYLYDAGYYVTWDDGYVIVAAVDDAVTP